MKIFVPLHPREIDALRELAQEERRRPQDMAAVLVARGLAERLRPHTAEAEEVAGAAR